MVDMVLVLGWLIVVLVEWLRILMFSIKNKFRK